MEIIFILCLFQNIERKWPGPRISFGFLNCPLGKTSIQHPASQDITKKYYELKNEIENDSILFML